MTVADKIWHEGILEITGIWCLSPSDTLLHKVFEVLVLVFCLWSIFLAAISCWRPYLVFLSGFLGDSMLLGTRKISRSSCTLFRVLSLLIGLMISSCITGRDVWSVQTALFVTGTRAGRRLIFEAGSLTDCCNKRQTAAAQLVSVFGVF